MRKKVSKKLTPLINYQLSINLVVKLRNEKSREIMFLESHFSGAPFGHFFRCDNLANFLNGDLLEYLLLKSREIIKT